MTAETFGASANLPQVRVSDAVRETIVRRLNDATSEGRLTLEEFSERVSAVLAARTQGDLDILMTDLPAHSPTLQSRAGGVPVPSSGPRISQITPIGSVKRGGHWRLDRDMEIGTVVGSAAVPGAPLLRLHVDTVVGRVKVYRR